ncbi:unnamed protein product [Choristocarpus tenellus]
MHCPLCVCAVDRAEKAIASGVRDKVERFKEDVNAQLKAFASSVTEVSHSFPHVEKALRYIVHDLAESIDGITSRTEGEPEDRHVVVYKLGYAPPEEDVLVDAQVGLG